MMATTPTPTTLADQFDRQLRIFDPAQHAPTLGRIALVGAGAIGNAMALTLAKMGIVEFHLYDYDRVEIHNNPNQLLYSIEDAGELKAQVAQEAIAKLVGGRPLTITVHPRRFVPSEARHYDTLILAVDSLATRRTIWEHIAPPRTTPQRFLDLRMGGLVAAAYAAQRQPDGWWPGGFLATYTRLVDGTVAADHDPCGARSFLPTAMIAAALGGFTLAAWGRGETPPFGNYLSFEATSTPFLLTSE